MAHSSRARVRRARAREPEGALLARARATEPPPRLQLSGFDIFAELKLRSPATGPLAEPDLDPSTQLAAYAAGGAAAVSVLTEPDAFAGSLAHLEDAVRLLTPMGLPVMRKDFLTEPYQVLEARAAGAGGVLIIVTMLSDEETNELVECAQECGLFTLLEAFTAEDLARIEGLLGTAANRREAPLLAGVNCRDLASLQVDFQRFSGLAESLPPQSPAVAESGIHGPEDVRQLSRAPLDLPPKVR